MQKNVELTIIIPVFNAEKYLKKCLDSILSQTYDNFEIICINDCSCDNSIAILNDYKKNDNRISIINNSKNLGPGASRNIGINKANGKYLTFIDSDDFYLNENCLLKLLNIIKSNNLDLLIFNNEEFDDNKKIYITQRQKRFDFPYKKEHIGHIWTRAEIEKHYFSIIPFPSSKIYDRELLIRNQILFPEGVYFEDTAFSNYISLFNKKVMVLDEAFFAYRVNVSTSTTQNIVSKFDSIVSIHKTMFDFLKQNGLYEVHLPAFVCLCIKSLCLYFLPQINDIEKAKELNLEIKEFILKLELSKAQYSAVKRKNPYVAYIINKYLQNGEFNLFSEFKLKIFKFTLFRYLNLIKTKQIYLFDFIPVYKIFYQSHNCSFHYLFNFIFLFKIKNQKIFLFGFFPFFKIEKFKNYTQNYNYVLYIDKLKNG